MLAAWLEHLGFLSTLARGWTGHLISSPRLQGLFLLLDIDDQGYIDVEEFIAGCCRIHGPAKAPGGVPTAFVCEVHGILLHHAHRQRMVTFMYDWSFQPLQELCSSTNRGSCNSCMF